MYTIHTVIIMTGFMQLTWLALSHLVRPTSIIAIWPPCAAACMGAHPSLFFMLRLHLAFECRYFIASRWPSCELKYIGAVPVGESKTL